MLESDYLSQYTRLIGTLDWEIELPRQWANFFQEKGHSPSCAHDERANQRYRLRTYGALWFENPLPAFPRGIEPIGIYTCDFSRTGCGILASFPLYPGEQVRVVLPTFWTRLTVARARRITRRCYEIGLTLDQRCDPSAEAFDPIGMAV